MSKKTWIVISIILIILVIICGSVTPKEKEEPETTSTNILENAQIESQNVKESEMKEFINIDVNEYINKLNSEEKSLVFVGRPTCTYCQIAEPIVKNIAYSYDINIYYLNTDEFKDDDNKTFRDSNEKFSEGFGTPMLLLISDGKINDMVDGLTDKSHYIGFLKANDIVE